MAKIEYRNAKLSPLKIKLVCRKLAIADKNLHYHNELVFILAIKGSAILQINDNQISISQGFFCLLEPYHLHRLFNIKQENFVYLSVEFPLALALLISQNKKVYQTTMKFLQQSLPLIYLSESVQKKVLAYCQWVKKQDDYLLNISLIGFLSTLYIDQLKKLADYSIKSSNWLSLQYLQTFHQNQAPIKTTAKQLQLTPVKVQQAIGQLTNSTWQRQLNQVRLRNTVALMIFDGLSLNAISRICGYHSEANFCKQFFQQFQQTPAAYRQQLVQQDQQLVSFEALEILNYLLTYYQQPIKLLQTTIALKLSPTKFQQLCQTYFHCSFKVLLTQIRINVAHRLLITGKLSVFQAAIKAGFQDSNTFTRVYKRYYQTTPQVIKNRRKFNHD
ncbi:MAG: helix-turn-helix domain-containing protein [Liquorilactobacillus ghanensis]|uniref:helix-turn-helix domain-containing protein n=1 Tax=Liquorilactobacillus ghanensis TaxID=399370 RepID=UPI0039E89047